MNIELRLLRQKDELIVKLRAEIAELKTRLGNALVTIDEGVEIIVEKDGEIDRLTRELDLYEKPCEACGGTGLGEMKPPKHGGSQPYESDCPSCLGTGYQRRWVLPEWFAKMIADDYGYNIAEGIPIEMRNNKFNVNMKLTRISDDLWELTEAKSE